MLGVLKKLPKDVAIGPEFFTDEFSWIFTMEDQADTGADLKSQTEFYNEYVLPTAPISIADSWSPFPLAFEVLPSIIDHGRTEERNSSAFAIFGPELLITGEKQFKASGEIVAKFSESINEDGIDFGGNIDVHHFFWLLQMTASRASQLERNIILAGTPGWSYKNELKYPTVPHRRLAILEAGYLYPERIPHSARRG